jgi:hypothetical protein
VLSQDKTTITSNSALLSKSQAVRTLSFFCYDFAAAWAVEISLEIGKIFQTRDI